MADFIKPKEEQVEPLAPSTLKIGDTEYTQEQVEEMVTRAQEVERLESQYNTKLDRVWPEYGKSQNRLKELEEELEDLKMKAANQPQPEVLPEEQIRQARDAAKRIGLVTDDEFLNTMSKNFKSLYQQERQAERLIDEGQRFEKEINGSDGRPKFVLEDILEHMVETGHK